MRCCGCRLTPIAEVLLRSGAKTFSYRCTSPFRLSLFVNIVKVVMISRLLGLSCSETGSVLLRAALLRLFSRDHSLKALGEGQDDQGDEVLDHLDDPSCWCPEFAFRVIDCASTAHEACRSRLARSVRHFCGRWFLVCRRCNRGLITVYWSMIARRDFTSFRVGGKVDDLVSVSALSVVRWFRIR